MRLRAERRVGELLKELQRATHSDAGKASGAARSPNVSNGGTRSPDVPATPYAEALQANRISRQSAHRYEQLANVPEPVFEQALRSPDIKPSTTRIIAQARDPSPRNEARDEPTLPSASASDSPGIARDFPTWFPT